METTQGNMDGRKVQGALIRPRLQIRMFFVGAGVGQIVLSAIFIIYLYFIEFVVISGFQGSGSEEVIASFQDSLFWIKVVVLIVTLIILSASLAAVIIFTHRVLGPTIPIIRLIEDLKSGSFGNQMRLREKDELKDVMTALNELSQELARRYPEAAERIKPS